MTYIWKYDEQTFFHLSLKNNICGIECFGSEKQSTMTQVLVNPIPRWEELFFMTKGDRQSCIGIISHEVEDVLKQNQLLRTTINSVFHFLAASDRAFMVTQRELVGSILVKEVQNGLFGEELRIVFTKLSEAFQQQLCEDYWNYRHDQSRMQVFEAILKKHWANAHMYYNKTTQKYMCYVPVKETQVAKAELQAITLLFWDITLEIEYQWYYHMGIIGQPTTLKIGQIGLY